MAGRRYNPRQARDKDGQWTDTPGGAAKKIAAKAVPKKSPPISYGLNPRTGKPFTPAEATAMLMGARKARKAPTKKTTRKR